MPTDLIRTFFQRSSFLRKKTVRMPVSILFLSDMRTIISATFILLFHIGNAQVKIVKVNTANNSPNEVSIAINPLNHANMVAASNIDNYYVSMDSGQSWKEYKGKSKYGVYGDPVIYADQFGYFYYCHLSKTENLPFPKWIDRMVIQKSDDGGITFNSGASTGFNGTKQQDKEWIVSDMSNSLMSGNMYMSWTEFDEYDSKDTSKHSRIRFSYSNNNAENFSDPITISDTTGDCRDGDNTLEGATPCVGPDGEVYIAWAGHNKIYFDKSLDGGFSFGNDVVVTDQPGGWEVPVNLIYRCNGMPFIACDYTATNEFSGRIYLNWMDTRHGDADIYSCWSNDKGASWSDPIRVNNDQIRNGKDQFLTHMTVDPVTGYIYIVYYDRRHSENNAFIDVYVAFSIDGGVTWKNKRITNQSFPSPGANVFFGDYITIAALNGIVRPLWVSYFDKQLEVKTAMINDIMLINDDFTKKDLSISQMELTGKKKRLIVHYFVPADQEYKIYTQANGKKKFIILKSGKGEGEDQEFIIKRRILKKGKRDLIIESGGQRIQSTYFPAE